MDVTSYLLGKKSSGGGGGGDTRWQEIGYNEEPTSIQVSIDQAKEIMRTWDASVTDRIGQYVSGSSGIYNGNYSFEYFPNVDTSNLQYASNMFSHLITLKELGEDFDFSNIWSADKMFYFCYNLRKLNNVMVKGTSSNMFYNCRNLKEINSLKISYGSQEVCSVIDDLRINHLYLESHYRNAKYPKFYGIGKLDILEITNTQTASGEKVFNGKLFQNCNDLTNNTLHATLNFLATLTDQASSSKTLATIGLTQEQAELCTTFSEWTELENVKVYNEFLWKRS